MTVEDDIRNMLDVGLTHYGLGEIDRAEEAWRQVLALDPANPRAQEYLRFVTDNWAPNQTRQREPYRPDEGSDGTGQRAAEAQVESPSAGEQPVLLVTEADALPAAEVVPDPPLAVEPASPDASTAPAAGALKHVPAHRSPAAQPAFIPPAKVPVKATFWGDLYNFEPSAPMSTPVPLPSVLPALEEPGEPAPDPPATPVGIPAAALFDMVSEPPQIPTPVVLENSPPVAAPLVEPNGEWEEVSPEAPAAEPAAGYTDGFDSGQTRPYQQVPTVMWTGVTEMAAVVDSALAGGFEPELEPVEPRRVTSTLPPPPVLAAPQPTAAPPVPVSEPPELAPEPPVPAVEPPPPAADLSPAPPEAESGWNAPIWQSAPPPPLVIHPRPPFASGQSEPGWRASESSALDLVGEAPPVPIAQAGQDAPVAPVDGRESMLRGARDLLELDDFSGALELLDRLLEMSPAHPEAMKLRAGAEAQLLRIYRSKVGELSRVPRVRMPGDEIIWLNLDHRAGFVLSLVDGNMSLDDILTISGLSELECLRILTQLLGEHVIEVD